MTTSPPTSPSPLTSPNPTTPAPSVRSHRRYGRSIAIALFGLLLGLVLFPDLARLDRFSPFSQLVAFRPALAVGATVLAIVVGLLALNFRWLGPFAMLLVVSVAVAAWLVLPRAVASPASVSPPPGRQLTVLAFNAFYGRADVGALADLIRAERPDLVALPETGVVFRGRLEPKIESSGYRILGADDRRGSEVGGMTVLVASHLGEVRTVSSPEVRFPYLELAGGELGELRFVAVHPVPPVPGQLPKWRDQVATLARWCRGGTPAIIAGDLNATLDHSVLRSAITGCSDAAAQQGAGLVGTWPSTKPRWLGPQIDHVLATDGIVASAFAVHDIPGSDHRAVVTRLVLPAG